MDRQDIDALLIGALYGELTPADEARLAAHLESHPADRSALEGMKATRDSVRASRLFDEQTEPPQAVSALLLQEAARRAPRRAPEAEARESWFHRFVRSFMAHPAMAAAAMLVLVVGVAGTLYVHDGDQFAEKTASAPEPAPAAATTADRADVAEAPPPADTPAQPGAGSGYAVGLAEEPQVVAAKDEGGERMKRAEHSAPAAKADKAKAAPAADGDAFAKAPAKPSKKGYVEVTTPDRMPKDLDSADEDEVATGAAYDNAASRSRAAGGAPATAASPPPPPPAPAQMAFDDKATAKPVAPPHKTAVATPSPQAAPGPATDRGLMAWAKQQHAAAIQKVKAGDCGAAATLAVQVKNRAPGYYAQYMQGDRELKSCTAYINDAELRDESANNKNRATKRASDDPAPATKK